MKQWYKVEGYRAHLGAGNSQSVNIYIFGESAIDALNRYEKMPAVKSHIIGYNLPNIKPLTEEESLELEKRIIKEERISLSKAKKTWYYSELI